MVQRHIGKAVHEWRCLSVDPD